MQKLTWKEKYAAVLVLLIGIIWLLMQIASIASNKSASYAMNEGALHINKNEFFSDIKTWLVIIMGVAAGFLLLRSKTLGWVLGLPVLLLFATFLLVTGIQQIITLNGKPNGSLTIPGVALLLLVLAIAFLLAKQTRRNYKISNRVVVLTLLLFVGLGGLYYFLQ